MTLRWMAISGVCVCDVTLPESRLVELLDKLRASVVMDMETRAAAAEGQNTNVNGRASNVVHRGTRGTAADALAPERSIGSVLPAT